MSWLTGKTKEITNPEQRNIRRDLAGYIQGQGIDTAITGANIDLGPFQKMFSENRALAIGQAKESVGNLTGSGLGHTIGTTINRSLSEENALLAKIRLDSAQRFMQLIGMIPSFQGQFAYQPGALDYAAGFAKNAAPFFSMGGGAGPGGAPQPDTEYLGEAPPGGGGYFG